MCWGIEGLYGQPHLHFAAVDSTNEVAKRLLMRAPEGPGATVTADYQWAGRGRGSRRWHSARGMGLWLSCSFLLGGCHPGHLALVAGAAVAECLRRRGVPAAVKWPNDVLVNGKKLAGVLGEVIRPGGKQWVVLGIGVNLNQVRDDFPAELWGRATSLKMETGRWWDPHQLAGQLLRHLEQGLLRARREPGEALRWWKGLCPWWGQTIRAHTPLGALTGRAVDVDAEGRLVVDTGSGMVALSSGEVSIGYPCDEVGDWR